MLSTSLPATWASVLTVLLELTSGEDPPCILSLAREVQRLRRWKWEFAPQNVGDLWDDRFVEACLNLDEKEYQLDLQLDPSAWRPSA